MSWWNSICAGCAEGQRPGGFSITDRAVEACGVCEKTILLDVGCGDGVSVRHLREKYGCKAVGVDSDPAFREYGVICAEAESLPAEDGSFDAVLIECALSQFKDSDAAVSECARVLKSGGFLIVTDLYARDGADHYGSCMGSLVSRETLEARYASFGFEQLIFEDHSEELISMWSGAMMSGDGTENASGLWKTAKSSGLKPGYCLWIGRKI